MSTRVYKTTEAQRRASKRWDQTHKEHRNRMTTKFLTEHPEVNRRNATKFRARQKEILGEFKALAAIDCF